MAGRSKPPARRSNQANRAGSNLAVGSPPPLASSAPLCVTTVGSRVQPGGDPPRPTWAQLHLFVVVYVIDGTEPKPEPEPEPDAGEQLPLPGFEPPTPRAQLAAMREALERPRARKKRPA